MREDVSIQRRIPQTFSALLLIVIVLAVSAGIYAQVRYHDFVTFDDNIMVYENTVVKGGWSFANFKWAFNLNKKKVTYWQPLTWLAHMSVCEFWGLDPGAHHLVNICIHWINGLLLFFLLYQFTDFPFRSAMVAGLFLLHPLNVESVAWVAELKSLISTFMGFLAILLYLSYTKKRTICRYGIMMIIFILSLMAKPMLVTLPVLLFLLDIWPLRQINPARFKVAGKNLFLQVQGAENSSHDESFAVLLEKIPLLIISFIFVVLNLFYCQHAGRLISYDMVPFGVRIANALVSYLVYMKKLILPVDLACFYPFPKHVPVWQWTGSLIVIIGLTVLALLFSKKRPYFLIGWLWYIVALLPVSGLTQHGLYPAMADRFSYVPSIGLFIIGVWGGADLLGSRRAAIVGFLIYIVFLGSMARLSWIQCGFWRNNINLYQRAVDIMPDNAKMHINLGQAYFVLDRMKKALAHYRKAAELDPQYPRLNYYFGGAFLKIADYETAIDYLQKTTEDKEIRSLYTKAKSQKMAFESAFQDALKRYQKQPQEPVNQYELGRLNAIKRRFEPAADFFRFAIHNNPKLIKNLYNWAIRCADKQYYTLSIFAFQLILEERPEWGAVYYNLACLYSMQQREKKGIESLKKAIANGYRNRQNILKDNDLKYLRRSKQYRNLLRNL